MLACLNCLIYLSDSVMSSSTTDSSSGSTLTGVMHSTLHFFTVVFPFPVYANVQLLNRVGLTVFRDFGSCNKNSFNI